MLGVLHGLNFVLVLVNAMVFVLWLKGPLGIIQYTNVSTRMDAKINWEPSWKICHVVCLSICVCVCHQTDERRTVGKF